MRSPLLAVVSVARGAALIAVFWSGSTGCDDGRGVFLGPSFEGASGLDASTSSASADGTEHGSNDGAGAGHGTHDVPLVDAAVIVSDGGELAPPSVRCTPTELGSLTGATLASAGSYAFASKDLALEDTSRKTPAHGSSPEGSSRKLPTTVWYPAGTALIGDRPVAQGGPFPLVVYAHGFNLDKSAGQYLGEHLASHGFIVAAPDFPRSKQNADGGSTFDDLVHQPGDVSFVIDALLGQQTSSALLAGAVDASRIAVVGYSLGGSTAMLVGYHHTLRDQRVAAVVSLAGIHAMFARSFFTGRALPALVMHGDLDAIVPYAPNARSALERGAPNVLLASIAKGTHVGFATLPLEPVVVGVAGPLIAPQGSSPNNADGLGCGTVGNLIPRDNAYLAPLGGVAAGITDPAPLDPCKLDQLSQPALAPADQRTPTKQAVLAFLRAYLDADASTRGAHCAFLEQKLGTETGISVD